MATIPRRKTACKIATASIEDQLDTLNVYDGSNNLGDANKFKGVIGKEGYCLTMDDDIHYHSGYVDYMVEKIEQYNRNAVITLHGKIIRDQPISSFYASNAFYRHRCMDEVKKDTPVHIPGTGVMAWHSDTIQFSMDDFKAPNMADIWAGIKCEKENVPRICVSHSKDFLGNLDGEGSCYQSNKDRDHILTEAINSIEWKEL